MCYGLISQIPDRILRWIGGPEQQSQATQMAGKIKGDTQGAASKGADAAGQSTRAPQVSAVSNDVQIGGAKKTGGKGATGEAGNNGGQGGGGGGGGGGGANVDGGKGPGERK